MAKKVRIKDLLSSPNDIDLQIEVVTGSKGLNKEITHSDVNRPGVSLAGFFDHFAYDRVQIFGRGESSYLDSFSEEEQRERIGRLFEYEIFCCIFTYGITPPDIFVDFAREHGTPVLVTELPTTPFISNLNYIITDAQAPEKTIHGTMVDVFGLGVLIVGKSAVGKSETALELLERGHRLIGDDIVIVKKINDNMVVSEGSALIRHHMEIRGLGILNVRDLFGIRSVRNRKRIELIVELEGWDEDKEYERFGLHEQFYDMLGVNIPYVLVPVRPGRNIPVLIESAALNQRLKKMGVFSAQELDKHIMEWMRVEREYDREKSDYQG